MMDDPNMIGPSYTKSNLDGVMGGGMDAAKLTWRHVSTCWVNRTANRELSESDRFQQQPHKTARVLVAITLRARDDGLSALGTHGGRLMLAVERL